ncbi:MAG TPA: hypothetical protein PLV45_07545 [bacterium]|nr:hypothetical protein [bacterium]
MASVSKKQINLIVAVVAVVIFGTWDFFIVPARQKSQVYRGTIAETYKKRKWWRGADDPFGGSKYRNYTYYWRIECDHGDDVAAEVPFHQWKDGEEGLPVKKVKGQRWPLIDTREAAEARQDRQKALDFVFGK